MTHPWRARRLQRAWRSLRGRNWGGGTSNDNGLRLLEFIGCVTASSLCLSQLPPYIVRDLVNACLEELLEANLHTRGCFTWEELTRSDAPEGCDADRDSQFSQLTHFIWITSGRDRLSIVMKELPQAILVVPRCVYCHS